MLAGATGSWSWDSILTCFKTTCFIRPSALNEPSWKNVAAFITESLLSLSVSSHHSRLTQSLSSTLFFSYTFFFLSRAVVFIIWTTHSFYLLFKKTSSTKRSSVPDTIVSSSSGFPGLGPASVHCSQLPQYILLFFFLMLLYWSLRQEFVLFLSPFPSSTTFIETVLYNLSTWSIRPATCCS